MENIIFIAIILGFMLMVALLGTKEKMKRQKLYDKKIRNSYGKMPENLSDSLRCEGIRGYYLRHIPKNGIDDITWNDLSMNRMFGQMNHTWSSAGEEYLYYCLRNPKFSKEDLDKLETEIAFFSNHEEQRVQLSSVLIGIGKNDKYSLYDYLDYLRTIYEKKEKKYAILAPIFIAIAVTLLFVQTGLGLTFLILAVMFNIVWYFKEKGEILPYFTTLRYMVRMLNAGKKCLGVNITVCEDIIETLRNSVNDLAPALRNANYIFSGESTSGDPLEIIRDYINMIFHFDLILFYRMIQKVKDKEESIDALSGAIGYLDTVMAIASYRKALENGYCIPLFHQDKCNQIADNIYHPLLKNPVKNSYEMDGPVLITGSNASGKSTFLKTMAVNQLLAQTIHTVCADSFMTGFYNIYSSMALKDSICEGDSYFMVEIKAMKRIVNRSQECNTSESIYPVLCFVDEVLRGTNTIERIAASTQILSFLAKQNVFCVAATHDMELTYLLTEYDNYHFEEEIVDEDVLFNYQLKKGKASSRNAIRLLKVMGYDEDIVEKANKMAVEFEQSGVWSIENGK